MNMRDIASNIGTVLALAPAVQTATVKGAAIDLLDFGSAAIVVTTGDIAGSGDFSIKLQESDTTTDGDFSDVAASDRIGSFPASLIASASAKQGYLGHKRYIRAVLTKNSGTSVAAGAVAVLGNARLRPVS
jgi:hypothetical protein